MIKRIFDFVCAFLGLIIISPLILIASLLVVFDSGFPIFYIAPRAGRLGRVFKMYKFRTMDKNADKIGGPSTAGDDFRLTKIGKILRRYQIDELPQFFNVLKGDMSFVGPRPEVLSEIETYNEEERKIILSIRPGLTDLATLSNIHEEEILAGSKNPHETYRRLIQPQKIKLQIEYVKKRNFWLDIKIIFQTIKIAIF